jgi:hypothetical protein
MKDNEQLTTVSNIKISKQCEKELRKIAIDKDIKWTQVISEIVEKAMSKKSGRDETVLN